MEEQPNPLAVTQLLQHTLRSFCNSQWLYAVFWRILPRNYPPPKWEGAVGMYDKSRGSKRNWILAWEDGFCNFGMNLKPEVFFKMSHEIYNYGEGWIGKVAADESHKWIYRDANEQEIDSLSAWQNSAEPHPRTWEAQFQSGIKTLALVGVREGVVQLGSLHKVIEDPNSVIQVRKRLNYIGSMLLPHPSSPAPLPSLFYTPTPPLNMNSRSLELLLSKLPVVTPPSSLVAPQFWMNNNDDEENGMPYYYHDCHSTRYDNDDDDDDRNKSSSSGYY